MANYHIKVDDTHEFQISSEELSTQDILQKSDTLFNIIDEDSSYNALIISEDKESKTYKVKVNDSYFRVFINNELDALIQDLGFDISSDALVSQIDAPMPGMVLDVKVKEGQQVQENEPLLILEAMKMENILSSPRDGIIKSVEVKQGDAVNKGQVLLHFED